MSAQYQGAGIWNCYVGNKVLVLSEAELLELQELEFSGGVIEKLKDEIENIKYEIEDLSEKLSENFENLLKIVDDDIFDENSFNGREEEIATDLVKV